MKRKKNKNLKDNKIIRLNLFLSLFLVVLLMSLSVGFALFTQVINIGANVALETQGSFEITNVTKMSSNNTSEEIPSWTADSIDFNLTFIHSDNPDPVYNATYNITLTNDTFYERLVSAFNFNFTINGSDDQSVGTLDYELNDIEEGTIIDPLSEKTFSVTFTFTPTVEADEYVVDGEGTIDSNEKAFGEMTVNSMTPATGSVKDGALQQVTISLNSTYQSNVDININIASDKLELVNAGGTALGSFTVPANSENQTYTFYIKAKDDALFPDDTITATLYAMSNNLPNVNLGNITLEVNKHEEYVDTTPPIISDLSATQSNEIGVVNLSWSGTDDYSGIKNYTILVCNNNGTVLQTIDAGTNTTYAVTGLSNGTTASTYNFKVYGTDNEDNTASSGDINNPSSGSGYCVQTGNNSYQWVFTVTRTLNNISGSGENSVNIGATYTCRLTANNNYNLPNTITVRMGNRNLTVNTDYTYNRNNGNVSIPNVNGNITITATGERSGICLIEGTKILMANGKYKNIEDIGYDDLMAVWSYNTGSLVYEYPIWIEETSIEDKYLQITFDDKETVNTSGDHGIYNYDLGMFVSTEDREHLKVGNRVAKVKNGKLKIVKITDIKYVYKKVKLYHVISSYYFNIISDDVITTDRNLMISNQYGFTKNISWPNKIQYKVKHDSSHLYKYDDFKDIMPYYIFKGLRVDEGKYLVDIGLTTYEELKMYLALFPANPDYYIDVETNKNGKRLWMVTTSLDKVTEKNKNKYKVEEGTYYKLPNKKHVKCFRNSIDNECYKPGDKIKVYSGMHFTVEYK